MLKKYIVMLLVSIFLSSLISLTYEIYKPFGILLSVAWIFNLGAGLIESDKLKRGDGDDKVS